jgi:2-polyprenyl-3-methyl-5-hydroxy-6-metoxy-1,4-benzoquinol methylase
MFDELLPVRLRELWTTAEQKGISRDECIAAQGRELEARARIWRGALLMPNEDDLVHSTLVEIGRWRGIDDLSDDLSIVQRRCVEAVRAVKQRWEQTVKEVDARGVEKFYDTAEDYIEELMWWHTLSEDNSPLAYVAALEFASMMRGRSYLDFGSGVGSGALLFRRHGFEVASADVSSVLLAFCKYRFEQRALDARFIDLKESSMPEGTFDFITAMDVFEHLVDPVRSVDLIDLALKPGGYIYGRFGADEDPDRPQHIVRDFAPVFERFTKLGFKEVFRDDWLWGHQVFQKGI